MILIEKRTSILKIKTKSDTITVSLYGDTIRSFIWMGSHKHNRHPNIIYKRFHLLQERIHFGIFVGRS